MSEHNLGLAGWFIPRLARTMIKVLGRLTRLKITGLELLDEVESNGDAAVLTFFHGRQFLLTYVLLGRKLGVMSSLSRDGELQTRTLEGLGFSIVRGSASRGGVRGLIGLIKLMKSGHHATFAVDGPKGPLNEVKPGAVYLAKKTGSPVLLMASSVKPSHIFERAWDRFMLPFPLAKGVAIFDGPVLFDDDISGDAIARDCLVLKERLLALQVRADEITGYRR